MPTLAQLESVVAAYFGGATSILTQNGVDLCLEAINNAIRSAQQANDWEDARIKAKISINGVHMTPLSEAEFIVGTATASIKEIVAVSRMRPDGTFIPLDFTRVDIPIERDRWELAMSDNVFPFLRYPSDAQISARGTNSSVVQMGENLGIYPHFAGLVPNADTPFEILIDGFGWWPELTADDLDTNNPNPIIQYGYQWLKWAVLEELNFVFKTWVNRVEGNLPQTEVTKRKDNEWRTLLIWDSYRVSANSTRDR